MDHLLAPVLLWVVLVQFGLIFFLVWTVYRTGCHAVHQGRERAENHKGEQHDDDCHRDSLDTSDKRVGVRG